MTSAPARGRQLLDRGTAGRREDPLGLAVTARSAPGRTALVEGSRTVTYAELERLVAARADELGPGTGVEAVVATRSVEGVVALLGAWRARRAVLLLPADAPAQRDRLLQAWPPAAYPDLTVHPDLALLLSTSGTTGAAKLVRLSHDNVASNAAAIADYLRITSDDVALTTLPLHYSYGLSVLTSHLLAGASVVLSEESVTRCTLWELAAREGVTSFAGVPHTFDLLETSGCLDRLPATLRYATVAGGRMAPDSVRTWASRVPSFVVMYGQTEATARMAWLPPHLAADRPDAIGVPIPGGTLRLDPVDGIDGADDGVGELVYAGPNVMLGYATSPDDLALGRTVHELRTGDLGVQDEDGLFRVVGRLARFAKVLGLRVDLDDVEAQLAAAGVRARVLEHEGGLAVLVRSGPAPARQRVLDRLGLPGHLIRVVPVDDLPVGPTGKRDDAPLRALLEAPVDGAPACAPAGAPASGGTAEQVRATYAAVLGRPDARLDQSFVDLGGDSLSYVEAGVRLGRLLGEVPAGWATMPASALGDVEARPSSSVEVRGAGRASKPSGRWSMVDTSLLLRAIAIVLVVGSHTDLWVVPGGAHTLLALVGLSLVRFQLPAASTRERCRRIGRTLRGIALPAVLVMGADAALRGTYDWTTVLGLNNLLGADHWTDQWRMWFVEAIVWGLVAVLALLAVPAVSRLERRRPYAVPLVLVGLTLVARWSTIGWTADNPERYSIPFAWTFLLLGWLVGRSTTTRLRLATTAVAAVATVGFFGDPVREGVVLGALVLLLVAPQVRVPTRVLGVVGVLAASSLWVYLLHWEVYPPIEEVSEPLALLASFGVGVPAWWAWTRAERALSARRRHSQ